MASVGLARALPKPVQLEYRENDDSAAGNGASDSMLADEVSATQPEMQVNQNTMATAPTPSEDDTASEDAEKATNEIKANGADKQDNATQPMVIDSSSAMPAVSAVVSVPSEDDTASEDAEKATNEIKANGADKQDNATQPMVIDSSSAMPAVSAVVSVPAEAPIAEDMNRNHKVEDVLEQQGDHTDMLLSDMSDIVDIAEDLETSSNDDATQIAGGNGKIEGKVAGVVDATTEHGKIEGKVTGGATTQERAHETAEHGKIEDKVAKKKIKLEIKVAHDNRRNVYNIY